MAWNGSGEYQRARNWVNDANQGLNIEANLMDQEDDNIAGGINNCLTKDGQNAPSQDLPMGGQKHTNVGPATGRDQYLQVGQYQDGWAVWGGTTDVAGTDDAFLLPDIEPSFTAYVAGMSFRLALDKDCADDATLNIRGVGPRNLQLNGLNVQAEDIVADEVIQVIYTGAVFAVFKSILPRELTVAHGCAVRTQLPADDVTFTISSEETIPFTEEIYDSDEYHDTVVDRDRLTIGTDLGGLFEWRFMVHVDPDQNFTGKFYIAKNSVRDTPIDVSCSLYTPFTTGGDRTFEVTGTGVIRLADGDFIEVIGDAQNVEAVLVEANFSITRIGD